MKLYKLNRPPSEKVDVSITVVSLMHMRFLFQPTGVGGGGAEGATAPPKLLI